MCAYCIEKTYDETPNALHCMLMLSYFVYIVLCKFFAFVLLVAAAADAAAVIITIYVCLCFKSAKICGTFEQFFHRSYEISLQRWRTIYWDWGRHTHTHTEIEQSKKKLFTQKNLYSFYLKQSSIWRECCDMLCPFRIFILCWLESNMDFSLCVRNGIFCLYNLLIPHKHMSTFSIGESLWNLNWIKIYSHPCCLFDSCMDNMTCLFWVNKIIGCNIWVDLACIKHLREREKESEWEKKKDLEFVQALKRDQTMFILISLPRRGLADRCECICSRFVNDEQFSNYFKSNQTVN